jgi:hypothetical protein
VFTRIDRAMKGHLLGQRTDAFSGAPSGVIVAVDQWVKSTPLGTSDSANSIVIRGRLDALVALEDGSTAILDFKTTAPKDPHLASYTDQLRGYLAAVEHPAIGNTAVVRALGLLCFAPVGFETGGEKAALVGDLRWVEVLRDDAEFDDLLREVVGVIEGRDLPLPAPGCAWCVHDEVRPERCCTTPIKVLRNHIVCESP